MDGANVVTEGLGSMTQLTEGFAYEPRGHGISREIEERIITIPVLYDLRNRVAGVFSELRSQLGEEISAEAIWEMVDSAILSQPGVTKKVNLAQMSIYEKMLMGLEKLNG
jgi:hypothetical protein